MKLALAAALFAGLIMVAGDTGTVLAQGKTVIKVGVTGRPDQSGLEIAHKRGYFSEQGLDVQFVQGGAAAQDYIAALASDQIQVAAGSPSAGMINALIRGIDIRIVADWARIGDPADSAIAIVGREDLMAAGTIKSVADLKGKSIAVGPSFGAYNEMLLDKALASAGLKRADVNTEFMGFAEGLPALANKKVDAAIMIQPLVWMAEQKKLGRVVASPGQLDLGAQVAVVLFSPQFAKNTDAATRYMVGYLRGVRDYHDAFIERKNTEAAVDLLVQHLALKDRRVWLESPPHRTDLNGRINVAHIKEQANFYKSTGSVSGNIPDLDKYVDMRFADEAVKRLGKR